MKGVDRVALATILSSGRHTTMGRSAADMARGIASLQQDDVRVTDEPETHYFRTLFISDVHLGKRGSQADLFLDFLRHHDAETIFLVGDMIDGWALRGGWYWPQSHNDVVQKLLRKVRKGARIIFVPGNHDEFARSYLGMTFGGIEVMDTAMHDMADGRTFLVIHGDQFDIVVSNAKWLAYLGDWAYEAALFSNHWFNKARRALGFPYWSFSAWAKLKVKKAINFIGTFEKTLVEEARKRGAQGVVCGHIHHPVIRDIDGMTYVNCGDFVESCTAIAEHHDGRLEIIHWHAPERDRGGVDERDAHAPSVEAAA